MVRYACVRSAVTAGFSQGQLGAIVVTVMLLQHLQLMEAGERVWWLRVFCCALYEMGTGRVFCPCHSTIAWKLHRLGAQQSMQGSHMAAGCRLCASVGGDNDASLMMAVMQLSSSLENG
jgi:hypothetical protein